MAGLVHDQNSEKRMEKQIGCMSGFLQIFDRQQVFAGKRIHSAKRLPPSTGDVASPEMERSVQSYVFSGEPEKHVAVVPARSDSSRSSPAGNADGSPIATPSNSPLPVPMFELKGETQKQDRRFCKEIVRLSSDSRTVDSGGIIFPRDVRTSNSDLSLNYADSDTSITDGDGKQSRAPSVIARLMGLEPLSCSDHKPQPPAKPALRRSSSESRVLRDICRSKYIDGDNFQVKQPNQTRKQTVGSIGRSDEGSLVGDRDSVNGSAMKSLALGNMKSESPRTSPWRLPQQRRGFDSSDIYPEPNQMTLSMQGDFEKKLKIRGMDEQSNDLGTLKQILDVLQLKGLLHSTRSPTRISQRNFVYDRRFTSDESSIVVMKPRQSPTSKVDNQRSAFASRGTRRYDSESPLSGSPKREGVTPTGSGRSPVRARNSSPTRIQSNLKACNSIVKHKPLIIEAPRRANESTDSQRISPTNSPNLAPKKSKLFNHSSIDRSMRIEKPTGSSNINPPKQKTIKNIVSDDESSSISESSVSTPSTINSESSKCDGYGEDRCLLHGCDKVLQNIPEMNRYTESPPSSAMVLQSPISVLDSGFDKEESSSPSHSTDFKAITAIDLEEEICSPWILPTKSTDYKEFISDNSDFIYISEILRASQHLHLHLHEDSNVFFSIEKHLYNSKDTSTVSKHQRKLVFDVVVEILDDFRKLPPWKSTSGSGTSLKQIWFEFQKIVEANAGDGELGFVGGVLKKDLYRSNGWGDYPIETSEAILDVERLIFKDLVGEMIRDLAEFSARCVFLRPQRKLVF